MEIRKDTERFTDQDYIEQLEEQVKIHESAYKYRTVNGMSEALAKAAATAEVYRDEAALNQVFQMNVQRQLDALKEVMQSKPQEKPAEDQEQPINIEDQDVFLLGFNGSSADQYAYRAAWNAKMEETADQE